MVLFFFFEFKQLIFFSFKDLIKETEKWSILLKWEDGTQSVMRNEPFIHNKSPFSRPVPFKGVFFEFYAPTNEYQFLPPGLFFGYDRFFLCFFIINHFFFVFILSKQIIHFYKNIVLFWTIIEKKNIHFPF